MSALDRLRQFEAERGYGITPSGAPVYDPAGYSSPREHENNRRVHAQLKAEAEKEERARGDRMGPVIRELVNQMRRQNMPGTVQIQLPQPHRGASWRAEDA